MANKRKPMMVGNWKMHKTWAETSVLAQAISNREKRTWDDADVAICPAQCNLKAAWEVLSFDRSHIKVGAQNVHWDDEGAYTGEVSVKMIKDVGASYCIVGHSERRAYEGETNEDVNRKVKALLKGGLTPIVCVGESERIRNDGTYLDYVCKQVSAAFAGLEADEVRNCVVAYEPLWAIGTGRTATPEEAQEVCASIRHEIATEYGQDAAERMRVLYGGSVKPENVDGLMAQPDIDGGLVGGASLDADSFTQLVDATLKK